MLAECQPARHSVRLSRPRCSSGGREWSTPDVFPATIRRHSPTGRTDRGMKPPPQFGQTLRSRSTQVMHEVLSSLRVIASPQRAAGPCHNPRSWGEAPAPCAPSCQPPAVTLGEASVSTPSPVHINPKSSRRRSGQGPAQSTKSRRQQRLWSHPPPPPAQRLRQRQPSAGFLSDASSHVFPSAGRSGGLPHTTRHAPQSVTFRRHGSAVRNSGAHRPHAIPRAAHLADPTRQDKPMIDVPQTGPRRSLVPQGRRLLGRCLHPFCRHRVAQTAGPIQCKLPAGVGSGNATIVAGRAVSPDRRERGRRPCTSRARTGRTGRSPGDLAPPPWLWRRWCV